MNIRRLLQLEFLPKSLDGALLVLRVWMGASLFLKHGFEKLTGYSRMVTHFPNPLHLGTHFSLAFALLSDGICSLLVILGVATRLACSIIVVNLAVVFFVVEKSRLFGPHNGELPFVYLGGFLAILLVGPGRFAVDRIFRNKS
jgi:putative oxidoreductase